MCVLITVYRSATFISMIMKVPRFELCTIICCDLLENTFFTTFLEICCHINTRASSEICVVQVLKMPSPTFYKIFYCCHSWCVLSVSIKKQNSIMYDLYMKIN